MKPLTRFLLVLLVIVGALMAKTAFASNISVVRTKHQNLFVMKVDKELEGALVEVFYSNGDLVSSQKVQKRKMIIDFCDSKAGEYKIRVVKGDKTQEFQYVKK